MSHDAFSRYDAAYVLGALSPADRRAFEQHLESCEACRRAVSDVAGLPGLLARIDPADLEPTDLDPAELPGAAPAGPVPETLLPRLLGEVRRRQRRRTWSLAGAAAATVAAVALGVGVVNGDRADSPVPPVAGQTMTQVDQSRLSAELAMEDVAWGTRLSITCTYTAGRYDGGEAPAYALVVRTRDGAEQVATWRAVVGKPTTVVAATAARSSDITSVEVRTTSGEPVLRLAG